MLEIGQPAPVFSLADADMESVDLAAFKGKKNVVLYFYPRDGTPGCTQQGIEFSDHEAEFARHDCVVLGVSPDDCISHAEFPRQTWPVGALARRHRSGGVRAIRRARG